MCRTHLYTNKFIHIKLETIFLPDRYQPHNHTTSLHPVMKPDTERSNFSSFPYLHSVLLFSERNEEVSSKVPAFMQRFSHLMSTQTTSHHKSAFTRSHPHMHTLLEVTALHGDTCSSEEVNIHTCIHTLMEQYLVSFSNSH